MKRIIIILSFCLIAPLLKGQTQANISNVCKISQTQGGFTGQLHAGDQFGIIKAIGDVDGDGIEDIASGAPWDDDGGTDWGAVWILFMNSDGTLKGQQKISARSGNFNYSLNYEAFFGRAISSLGDFDKDGIPDIVVGAWGDNDGGTGCGSVFLLFLNRDGTVKSSQKISATKGGLVGLTMKRQFGFGVTSLGDLNEDGITDIAVGTPTYDNDGGLYRGCVWILFLNANGTVKAQQKINDYQGGFTGDLDDGDRFGLSLENMGDINKDGIIDIAVQAYNDDDGGSNTGAIYILFLNKNGTVKHHQKISALQGNFQGKINPFDLFGIGISNLGDIDGDGTNDMLTSSYLSDECGTDRGKAWILYMNTNGTVKSHSEIGCREPYFSSKLDNVDYFGISVSCFKGLKGNGIKKLIVGSIGDDDGYTNAGAIYIFDLDTITTEPEIISNVRKISQTQGGFTGQLHTGDSFGIIKAIGDVNGDGIEDIAAGAPWDNDGGTSCGAVWILFMNKNGTVKGQQKISSISGNFNQTLNTESYFGRALTSIGDFNKDGTPDIVVGAWGNDDGGNACGAVWLLFLNNNGTVKSSSKISATQGGLIGLTENRQFGFGVTSLGDLDKDGITDIAVGSPTYDNDGGLYRGCVWVLFLNANGTVKAQQKINDYQGGFSGDLDDGDRFGLSIENIGDINRDGIIDIAVQAYNDDDGGTDAGAIYILFLNANGTVKHTQKISALEGNFGGTINAGDLWGISIANLGDIDGDGINDILTGSYLSDDCGIDRGKIWILYLNSDATVKNCKEISCSNPSLTGLIDDADNFGISASSFIKTTEVGKKQIIIGAIGDDDGFSNAGAIYILDLEAFIPESEIISNVRKISQTQGGFTGQLHAGDQFGIIKAIGDVDGDGIEDIASGAPWDDDGGTDWGAVWILFMNSDGTVKGQQKISAQSGNFNYSLNYEAFFGRAISSLGDFDKDGIPDIVVGAWGDNDGGTGCGSVFLLFLNRDGTVKSSQKISATKGGLIGLTPSRQFGFGVTSLGDLDEDGITDIAVGTPTYDNDGGLYRGCVWVLFLNANGTVKAQQKINDYQGGFTGILDDEDRFGLSLENMGDINKDGIIDIAVQAYNDDDGGNNTGAIYILFLNKNGTVKHHQKISALQGNFKGKINPSDLFGIGISNLGDIDGDGTNDMLTSSYLSDDCGTDRGKAWILYMNTNGTVKNHSEIGCQDPYFSDKLDNVDYFGISVSCFSRYSENGNKELLVGSIGDDDGNTNAGAVYILDLYVEHKPVANAGPDQTVGEGTLVTLDGSDSYDLNQQNITYSWSAPAEVTLSDSTIALPTFAVPEGIIDVSYQFILTVNDGISNSQADTVLISVINDVLSMSNFMLDNGASECFNAITNIVIGGLGIDSNSDFRGTVEFMSGSTATIIAGESIRFLPGFHAHEGAFMNANITSDGVFCNEPQRSIVNAQPAEKSNESIGQENEKSNLVSVKEVKVYPNPNNGCFIVKLTHFECNEIVRVYNSYGAKLYQALTNDNTMHEVILPSASKGIYFVIVGSGNEQFIRKIAVE